GYIIKFLLHPVLSDYKLLMKECEDEYIKVYSVEEVNYSNLFNECSMLITDYSSIHFDVATLLKPIIYFQFDKEEFFKKHYSAGYFDYSKDGFGEVIEDEVKLEEEIISYLLNDCKIKEKYKDKIYNTFINVDKNNSKRVFDEIIKLDNRNEINYRFNNVH
ncbi:MAG: CDP-glycerol glycerophosphotransferase family protein, partial [Clostridia bacterium]|nr:CDP-glycerol glycerophosphotransferase family protein [Clostridia bacterium]